MSKKIRQFKHKKTKPIYFDRKVQRGSTGAILSITKVVPKDWGYVRISVLEQNEKELTLKITKLLAVNNVAQVNGNHKAGEQNT